MKQFITLSKSFQPAKGRFNWAEIRAIGQKIDNFFTTSRCSLLSSTEIVMDALYLVSIKDLICSPLWMQQLSMQLSIMITELGTGKSFICRRSPLMKSVNDSKVNEPSTILSQMMPSRHMAGRTEYLCEAIDNTINDVPQHKEGGTPLTTNEMAVFCCMLPMKRPAIGAISCTLVKGTLINKNELLRFILPDLKQEVSVTVFAVLNHNLCQLRSVQSEWLRSKINIIYSSHLFPHQPSSLLCTPDGRNRDINVSKLT